MKLRQDIDFSTLNWVKEELDETLRQARIALDAYAEDNDDASQMRFCATYLHQAQGTLRMVELYGAALLVEEMETVALGLLEGEVKQSEDVFGVLMRALVQLPDYLERLEGGHRDIPVVLLPLLNDLRAARGAKLLSENVLFSPDLTSPLPVSASGPELPVEPTALKPAVARLRSAFELALLRWIKDESSNASLERIGAVMDRLQRVTHTTDIRRLWWVCGGLVETLLSQGFDSLVSIKLLFGRIDRTLRKFVEEGEHGLAQHPPEALTRSVLYYVAQVPPTGERTRELHELYNLTELLPRAEELEHAEGSLSGRNRELLDTVSVAIKEDLLRVKDALDLHMRQNDPVLDELAPLAEELDRVADTLGMLGLGIPRKVILEQKDTVDAVVSGEREADEKTLLDVAGALLYVESSLDDHIDSLGQAGADELEAEPSPDEQTTGFDLPRSEVRRILGALIKEANGNLQGVKQAVVAFIESPWEHDKLVEAPAMLDEITGAMRMLDLPRPATYVQGLSRYFREELLEKRVVPEPDQLDTLADAVASIEYYLEGVKEQRPQPQSILDVARSSLEKLGYAIDATEPAEADAEPEFSLEVEVDSAESDAMDVPEFSLDDGGAEPEIELTLEDDSDESEFELTLDGEPELEPVLEDAAEEPETELALLDDDAEPEIELAPLDEDAEPEIELALIDEDPEPDIELTLEGEAPEPDGELQLEDHSTELDLDLSQDDQAVEPDLGLALDLEDAEAAGDEGELEPAFQDVGELPASLGAGEPESMPALGEMAEGGASLDVDSDFELDVALDDPSDAEAAPDRHEAVASDDASEPEIAPPADREPFVVGEVDEEIREIFVEEFEEELEAQGEHYPRWRNDPSDTEALATLRRSFHTLKGSGRLVGATGIGEFAWKVEDLLNPILENEEAPSPALLAAMDHVIDTMPQMFKTLTEGEQPTTNIAELESVLIRLREGEEAWMESDLQAPVESAEGDLAVTVDLEDEVAAADETAPASDTPEVALDVEALIEGADAFEGTPGSDEETTSEPAAVDDVGEEAVEVELATPEFDESDQASDTDESQAIDPVLLDILRGEVAAHIGVVDAYIEAAAAEPDKAPATESAMRAVHTLTGATAMVDVPELTTICEPMERYIKELHARGEAPSAAGREALTQATRLIDVAVASLDSEDPAPDTSECGGETRRVGGRAAAANVKG